MDIEAGHFYIGRRVEDDQPVLYESGDLTTHGVIVGMTGSGKTGLGVGLIEEALLNGIPCLVIDPKGDMGNLALTFPDLEPADFEAWIDPATAAKEGKTPVDMATETASKWRAGLEGHEIDTERIRRLTESSQVTIYTPGSGAGVGLNVLGSLRAPTLGWETGAEVIRDEIQSFVSSLLTLASIESDPVSGPEHILLSTIVETLWRQGQDLDLATLVGQIPHPPFRKLGVFDVDTFIPGKDRMSLALKLNGLLASPSFASWLEGVPLDIETMIGGDGPTKAAVVYLTHLSDEERQFLVTLLLSKMVTWIRSRPGTSELVALIYMDEVFGYVPPTAQPPSKKPILTIFKQARAHGVGMVLSTQNPVDLDYKAMSNAGTWMIGRLQTENDKRRILEGLASATGAVDTDQLSRLISDLEKRQFVLHSTKTATPTLFSTRWAMSYLAGPLTRDQVANLMRDRRSVPVERTRIEPAVSPKAQTGEAVPVAPQVAEGTAVSYLDPAAHWSSEVGALPTSTFLEAAAAVSAQVVYDDTTAGIEHREAFEAILYPLDGLLDQGDVIVVDHDDRDFRSTAPAGAVYRLLEVDIGSKTFWSDLKKQLVDYLVAHRPVRVFRNPELELYSRVGEGEAEFIERCRAAAEDAADIAMSKLKDRYQSRVVRVKDQILAAETRVSTAEQDAAARQQEEVLSGAGDLLGALFGGRSRSNPLGKVASRRSATQKARVRADAERTKLTAKERELVDLEAELAEEVAAIVEDHQSKAEIIEPVDIPLEKTDVAIGDIRLVWIPVGIK